MRAAPSGVGPPPILNGLYNGSVLGSTYSIGAIRRISGTWVVPESPVISPGAATTWDDATVKDPFLVHDGSQWVCYYAGYDGSTYRVGRATAASVIGSWTKYGSNPVLDVGSGGSFDDAGCSFPTVLYEPGLTPAWKMWYSANDGSAQTVGYAYSSDGLSWTKHGQVITLGSGGSWNDVGLFPGGVVKVGDVYHLFVGGRQDAGSNPKWQIGLWTFSDPTGSYTPAAGNPVLQARFNESASATLTSDTTTGSGVVTVNSTSLFSQGEPAVLYDANSVPLVTKIRRVESSTQVILADPAAADYTTSQGAVLRPLTYNSVSPRSVWREGSRWVMGVTAFQPVNDLSGGTSYLREGIILAYADDLEGPWTWDFASSLIIPLGSGWDSASAENLSVSFAR